LSLALHLAHQLIQNQLHAHAFNHLMVRVHESQLLIYSVEQQGEVGRAILSHSPGDEYLLSIASPRGSWQPTPFAGPLPELISVLTGKLAFVLARWH
jgi:hypothetical protein